jgi:hypothetical protein
LPRPDTPKNSTNGSSNDWLVEALENPKASKSLKKQQQGTLDRFIIDKKQI